MPRSLEEIVGKIESEWVLAGTRLGEENRVRFVSFSPGQLPKVEFRKVVRAIDPPIAGDGGVTLEPGIVVIPDGTSFYPLYLSGDIDGWRRQVERGAEILGLFTAWIGSGQFVVSNGQTYLLTSLKIIR